jgi:DNA-binding NarL/FixJ family response regulator
MGPHSNDRVIRVLIADDHTLFAETLALALRHDPRFAVVGLAQNGRQAVDLGSSLQPDVVLMDLHMPVLDGIEATRLLRIASPRSRVVVVTASTSPEDGARARAAGACAYIRKWASAEDLRDAVVEATVEATADPPPFRNRWSTGMTRLILRSA